MSNGFFTFPHPAAARHVEGANKDFALGQYVLCTAVSQTPSLNSTDGNDATSMNAGNVTMPQLWFIELAAPRYVRQARFRWQDTAHSAQDGTLEYYDDRRDLWVVAAKWFGLTAVTLLLSVGVRASRWRLVATRAGVPGGAGINIASWNMYG